MSDLLDMAAGIEAEHLARSLAGIARDIPAGIAGQCADCGETMPRLVDGRCGFCRDGRTPPDSFFDRPAPVAIPFAPQKETITMSQTLTPNRKITFEGLALQAIDERADFAGTSFKEAAEQLILAGIGRSGPSAPLPGGVLSVCDTDELLDELRARIELMASARDLSADLTEMTDRAAAAEARLAKIESVFRGDAA